jgi:hypothetical protein
MTEKYDVVDLTRRAGGRRVPPQDGFGWIQRRALASARSCAPPARAAVRAALEVRLSAQVEHVHRARASVASGT